MKIAIAIDKQPEKKEKESTRIIFLLDRSTSMNSMREEAVSGFNHYI
jgi:Mg-chelatase subunit ChlD